MWHTLAMTVEFDVASFYKALDSRRQREGMAWRDVAQAAGVSPSTLSRMSFGRHPSLTGAVRLSSWLNLGLECWVVATHD